MEAVLQQREENKGTPIGYASRFLTELESKYSFNELELLAVIWLIEHFNSYVYGTAFEIVSDHKALQSVLKSKKSNKSFSSRLTRLVDRLLPFEFSIVHTPGGTLGMADYLPRHPSEYEGSLAKAEEMFNDWVSVNVPKEITPEMKRLASWRKPIRSQESKKVQLTRANKTFWSVHAPMQTNSELEKAKIVDKQLIEMAEAKDLTKSKISSLYVKANAENDRTIQKVTNLVLNKNTAVIANYLHPGGKNLIP